jgi:hypothetical protein
MTRENMTNDTMYKREEKRRRMMTKKKVLVPKREKSTARYHDNIDATPFSPPHHMGFDHI